MRRLVEGRLTLHHYASILRVIYHCTRENPQIQALAAVYFRGADPDLVQAFFKHASAEIGHDRMALADLVALGHDSSRVPMCMPLPNTTALVSFPFYQIVYRNPISYLGYLYFLEHMPTRGGATYAAALLACGVPRNALGFLAEHTSVDVAHNALMRRYVEALVRSPADLADMAYAIRVTSVLYGNMLAGAVDAAGRQEVPVPDHGELARMLAEA